jgi:TonB family protein
MSFVSPLSENAANSISSNRIFSGSFPRFFAAIAATFILTLLFLEIDLRALIFGKNSEKTENAKIIQALLENAVPKTKGRTDTVKFLSDKDSAASGKLTREKGFESASTDYVLAPGETQAIQARIVKAERYAKVLTSPEGRHRVTINTEDAKTQAAAPQTAAPQLRIPSYYRFRHDFALSWDHEGRPAIPTARYEHYSYFRAMVNKIQNVWAPPGGDPYPTFGDSYHRMNGAGWTRFSTFPSQDIYIQFLLDDQGVVRDAKLVSSLGYQSLDRSCIEALYAAREFGPPPKALLENGVLIIPFVFRIIVR